MPSPVSCLSTTVWEALCQTRLVRAPAVAAGRARLQTGDWPTPLDLADALLRGLPPDPDGIC